jgi:hypothetical protein
MIKWKGYDDPTPERLSDILKDTRHPDVLREIEAAKARYNAVHPSTTVDAEDAASVEPPPRPVRKSPRLAEVFYTELVGQTSCTYVLAQALPALCRQMKLRAQAVNFLMEDKLC